MDETTTTAQKKVQDALSGVPEEVQSFMWGPSFETIIKTMQQTLALTDEQTTTVQNDSYMLLIQLSTMEEIYKKWVNLSIPEELVVKILYLIDREILSRAKDITDFFTSDEDETFEDTTTKTVSAPSPSEVLATLGARLSQSSVIVPSKRDYSMDTQSGEKPGMQQSTPSIDPYRELPEK
ncbi:MAG: hypothetical protein ACOYMZ_01260 [Minisyncoccia bacterium]